MIFKFLEENLEDRQKAPIHIWLKIKIRVTKFYDQRLYHMKNHYASYVKKRSKVELQVKLSSNVELQNFDEKIYKVAQV